MRIRSAQACAVYLVIALAATWPLARGLGRDVAWDIGDSVLVMWALAWNCEQLLALLRGDLARIPTFFDANIFYPAQHTLAYSEHFFGQAVQIFPVYALTGNPILCYNLLFVSTFVLSGLGMFLFVRQLTGHPTAALVAGLLFAFAPYRIPQASHLQVLSSQWMPLALFGIRRYFDTGRRLPLAGAAVSLVMQNLSCGYYLLYFSPFAAAYACWELVQRAHWRRPAVWRDLGVTAAAVVICTAPFLLPYASVRDRLRMGRVADEVVRYSADVHSYATAFSEQPLWGRVAQAFPKAEGQLFPGLVTLLLAAVGVCAGWPRLSPSAAHAPPDAQPTRVRWLVRVLVAAVLVHLVLIGLTLVRRRLAFDVGGFAVRVTDIDQLLIRAGVLMALLLTVSPNARTRTRAFMRARGFFVVALVVALWLSLGPLPLSLGRPLNLVGLYGFLYDYVPGFEGVRAPARFGMIVTLMLAVLGGFGAERLARVRGGGALLAAACALFLAESLVTPFTVNGMEPLTAFNTPEARLYPPADAPAVYRAVAAEPAGAVLADLPLGVPDFDLRAMLYSTVHWKRLLNGYSGFFPMHYGPLTIALEHVPEHPEQSWQALRASGATHVLVHENAYLGQEGPLTSQALQARGAQEIFRDRGDVLLRLP